MQWGQDTTGGDLLVACRVHGLIRTRLLPKEYATMDLLGVLWPASIVPYSIQRLTAEERRQHDR